MEINVTLSNLQNAEEGDVLFVIISNDKAFNFTYMKQNGNLSLNAGGTEVPLDGSTICIKEDNDKVNTIICNPEKEDVYISIGTEEITELKVYSGNDKSGVHFAEIEYAETETDENESVETETDEGETNDSSSDDNANSEEGENEETPVVTLPANNKEQVNEEVGGDVDAETTEALVTTDAVTPATSDKEGKGSIGILIAVAVLLAAAAGAGFWYVYKGKKKPASFENNIKSDEPSASTTTVQIHDDDNSSSQCASVSESQPVSQPVNNNLNMSSNNIASSETNTINQPGFNGGMDQNGYNTGMDQSSYNNGMNQNSYNSGMEQSGYNNGMDQNGYNTGMDQSGYNNGMNQNGYNNGMNQNSYNSAIDQSGYNTGMDQSSYNNGISQNGYNTGMEQSGYNNGMTQNGYNTGMDQNVLSQPTTSVSAVFTVGSDFYTGYASATTVKDGEFKFYKISMDTRTNQGNNFALTDVTNQNNLVKKSSMFVQKDGIIILNPYKFKNSVISKADIDGSFLREIYDIPEFNGDSVRFSAIHGAVIDAELKVVQKGKIIL